MIINALTLRERSYLLGLYLADGSLCRNGKKSWRVRYTFQGNEGEIAGRVAGVLKRCDLRPHTQISEGKYAIEVAVYSSNLNKFFPKKTMLRRNEEARRKFYDENKLLDVEYGVAFSAGLLDGDGHCQVAWEKRGFRSIDQWKWQFVQSKLSCMFLVGYIERLVKFLAPDGRAVRVCPSGRGKVRASIWKAGINALLNAGIAEYSWKVAQWLKKSAEYQREREGYRTVGQVARALDVGAQTVRRWYKIGQIKGCQRRGGWRFIPIGEVEKLREWLKEESRRVDRVKSEGVKLADAGKMVGASRNTIWKLCKVRKLPSTLVREGDHRYLIIPKDSVELLKLQLKRSSD